MKELKKDERIIAQFGDEAEIAFPRKPIDCSRLGYFDDLEYECWDLVKRYAEWLGIEIITEDEDGISFDVAKDIQELILKWFEGAGVKFRFTDEEPEDEEASELSYEERIIALEEKAARIGAKFEHNFYDKDHLDCFWYDGFDIAIIDYKGHTVCFDVNGDISAGVDVGDDIIPLSHRGGSEAMYHDCDCRKIIPDDAALTDLVHSNRINYEANNWISSVVFNPDTEEYVCEPEIGSFDNLLKEVENSFDFWINYIDNLVDKK